MAKPGKSLNKGQSPKKPMPSGAHKNKTAKWTKATRPRSPGRPKGAKDKHPRTWKGTIKSIFEEIASDDPDLLRNAIIKGLKAPAPKSFHYLQIMTHYIDGKPVEAVPVADVRRLVREIGMVFMQIVPDPALRGQFASSIRGLIGPRESVIDADPGPKSP